ncbi:very short patch repair endonuclease [Gaopeijia maritima]|uniref:very short patch repair endonuclease n=1 Tax=Gaopeijia maritima TaxID=3119007 RepID=UPI003253370D
MGRVGSKDTAPEMKVRRVLHSIGARYRTHVRGLPGSPDIANRSKRRVIFVHGCYWHRHEGCPKSTTPKTRVEFWTKKFEANVQRDRSSEEKLRRLGYHVLTVWECETEADDLGASLRAFWFGDQDA